ncbi:MAG: hypothetical protein LH618_04310, partial [Saprospiraceae bacterium]|nr:hypothetical protein [Saprospiraceae bacterium]
LPPRALRSRAILLRLMLSRVIFGILNTKEHEWAHKWVCFKLSPPSAPGKGWRKRRFEMHPHNWPGGPCVARIVKNLKIIQNIGWL